jgi:hypothetical protein
MTDWTDTKQQKAILRQNRIARKVRATYPQGTRVTTGRMEGIVYRHVPHSNSQGGVLVVDWENGHRGRISPIAIRPA